jgi:predicted dehydrogenase
MKNLLYTITLISGVLAFLSCKKQQETTDAGNQFSGREGEIELVVLDPGHFHASLLQKFPQQLVNDTVLVYAPEGEELQQYLHSIEEYNRRAENPTDWHVDVYADRDYLEKMNGEKKGNVVVLAGNNSKKIEYISKSIQAGYNVLSDKPMVIDKAGFELLEATFDSTRTHDVLLYDVMTERYDILNTIVRVLVDSEELFGEVQAGTAEEPAIVMQSVHHYFKEVSGNVLVRPAWFYDVEQQGEGIADVATHLVDLVHWQCFPDEVIDYRTDVLITSAHHWPTRLTLADFTRSTRLNAYPDYLRKYVKDNILEVFGNGTIHYQVKGKNIAVTAIWNYEAPQGGGDAYSALIKGTHATVEIVQNKEENYIKQLYIEKEKATDRKVFESALHTVIAELQKMVPSISSKPVTEGRYQIIVPVEDRKGHEDYFGMVAKNYFEFLIAQNMPEWEISNMIAKYYITTTALDMAKKDY